MTSSIPADRAAPIYLDCDTGIDDALAIAYLLAEDANLVGIGTVCGNIDAPQGAANTAALLKLFGTDIPVAVGAEHFTNHPFTGGAPEVHGANGIGNVTLQPHPKLISTDNAGDLLLRLARQNPGTLRILAIGPLTNLADTISRRPEIVDLVADVVIMGGALTVPGNVSPHAEANIWNDPEAAAAVLRANWTVTLVPLDVTMRHLIDDTHVQQLAGSSHPGVTAIAAMLDHYLSFYESRLGRRAAGLHDPLAAAVLLGTVTTSTSHVGPVTVDVTDLPTRGRLQTAAGDSSTDATTVLGIEEAFADILTATLTHPRVDADENTLTR